MNERDKYSARRVAAQAEIDAIRGEFLAAMIDLESHVDRAIVFFFAPDEHPLFIDVVLDRLNFASKIQALRKMLQMTKLAEKHQSFLKELDALRIERNH